MSEPDEPIKILIGFVPEHPAEEPVTDDATRRVTDALRRNMASLFPNEQTRCCGRLLAAHHVTFTSDGRTFVLPSHGVHLIARHREEALLFDPALLDKVALLPEPGIPTLLEIEGRHLILR